MNKVLDDFEVETFIDKPTLSGNNGIKIAIFSNIFEIFNANLDANPISIKAKFISTVRQVFISLQATSFL